MQTEYLLINDCTQPQIVKDFGAILPRLSIAILLHNLVIKPILLTNSATFVIASQQCDTRWIFDLQAQQELKCLHRVVASIDVITHKDVPRVWNLPTFVEQLQQIMELTVNVTTNDNRSSYWLHV